MSFPWFRRVERFPTNETASPGFGYLPISILDAFIPGYSVVSEYLLEAFGFDISITVSILFLGLACITGTHYIYRNLWASFLAYFTASVAIDYHDTIYDNILSWAAEQEDLKRVRSLRVRSVDYADDVDLSKGEDSGDDDTIFNFNSWAAKVPPRYEPDSGCHWFRHNGSWFKLSRERTKVQGGWMGMMIHDQETLRLTVLGRSSQPIKQLLLDTRDRVLSKQIPRTTIRRPSPKEHRGHGREAWSKVAVRPTRPMGTVVLDSQQKAAILRDINDFLDPATCRWYSSRGLPYRRGYLLHGPPGTGKTSLCFSLAGVFGLDIYCMSLSEKKMSEEDLILLFNSLPKRCVVLLEDIDSAGVDGGDHSPLSRSGNGAGVTLSGLLNAIDGVASQEGRVLIMTTNHAELLDDALIRPGRVDMKIEFTRASKQQIRELFVRMYCVDSCEVVRPPTNLNQILPDTLGVGSPVSESKMSEKSDEDPGQSLLPPTKLLTPTPSRTPISGASSLNPAGSGLSDSQALGELEKLADLFASHLPEMVFLPAEVQGYLITRKKDPQNAVTQVEAWRDAKLTKESRENERSEGEEKGREGSKGKCDHEEREEYRVAG